MNSSVGIKKFIGYISPAYYASRKTFPAYKGTMRQIVIFSGIASVLETVGLGLIYFLILIFSGKQSGSIPSLPLADDFLSSPLAITLSSVVLLTAGLRLKRAMIAKTMVASSQSGQYGGKMAIAHAKKIMLQGGRAPSEKKSYRSIMSVLLKEIPFGCGFAARGFSLIAINMVQASILFLVMLFLSPLLTVSVLIVSVLFLGFLAINYETLLGVTEDRSQGKAAYRVELDQLSVGLVDPNTTEDVFSAQTETALSTGSASEQLKLRTALRANKAAGSMVVEYIYPIAVIGISLLYTYSDGFAPDITKIAIYFLLMRQAVSSLYSAGSTFISFSIHHLALQAFMTLMEENKLPQGKLADMITPD